jgi:TatD DNase family protein
VLETDAPYLAPVPKRGKPNEPAYVAHVAAKLAEVLGLSVAEVERVTTANAERLFPRIKPAA